MVSRRRQSVKTVVSIVIIRRTGAMVKGFFTDSVLVVPIRITELDRWPPASMPVVYWINGIQTTCLFRLIEYSCLREEVF
jgi:hypothetical protein